MHYTVRLYLSISSPYTFTFFKNYVHWNIQQHQNDKIWLSCGDSKRTCRTLAFIIKFSRAWTRYKIQVREWKTLPIPVIIRATSSDISIRSRETWRNVSEQILSLPQWRTRWLLMFALWCMSLWNAPCDFERDLLWNNVDKHQKCRAKQIFHECCTALF